MKAKILILFLVIAVIACGVYFRDSLTGYLVRYSFINKTSPTVQAEGVIDMPPDFVDENLGTMVFWTNVDLRERSEGVVQFFASKKLKGFALRYRLSDKRAMAGLPVLVSGKENSLDGNNHMIAYSFKRDMGQTLYFDGEPVAQGTFTGTLESEPVGMVVSYPPEQIKAEGVQVFAKSLGADEIKALYAEGSVS
jgi:hypothetical protein